MERKYMTVVFEITDEGKFKPVKDSILKSFSSGGGDGFRVTAVSGEDEMTKLDTLEHGGGDAL